MIASTRLAPRPVFPPILLALAVVACGLPGAAPPLGGHGRHASALGVAAANRDGGSPPLDPLAVGDPIAACPQQGQPCTPQNSCDLGAQACDVNGNLLCQDLGPDSTQDGQVCGEGGSGTCATGVCSTCIQGAYCLPANTCDTGTIDCSSGVTVCVDQGTDPTQDGVACGPGSYCLGGTCGACAAGAYCLPDDVCDQGTVSCATGAPVCLDQGADPGQDGVACGGIQICLGGTCGGCNDGTACVPDNPCDVGLIDCSSGQPVCNDQGSDATQDGVSCGASRVCSGGSCAAALGAPTATSTGSNATGGSGGGAGGGGSAPAALPTVPNNGGGVVAAPNLVMITYDSDTHRPTYEAYANWLATGGYLATVGSEYGVGNGTWTTAHLSDTPPLSAAAIDGYLQQHLNDGSLPAFAPNNIYILVLPNSAARTFCQTNGGFHTYFGDSNGHKVLYAITPDCLGSPQDVEVTISHEVVEASTDPYVTTYQITDPTNPWAYLGGEIGDLCASNSTYFSDSTGQYQAQLIWSNAAAQSGAPPCVPWPGTSPYLSVSASPATTQIAPAGSQVTFTLTGASSSATGTFGLFAQNGDYLVSFQSTPQLSTTQITADGSAASQVTLTLTIPTTATSGQRGAVWVVTQDPHTFRNVGSTMVSVQVQ